MRVLILVLLSAWVSPLLAQTLDMQALLDAVRAGRHADTQQHAQRLREFKARRTEQQQAVQQLRTRKQQLEQQLGDMEKRFAAQREQLTALSQQRDERMGDLKELFGVIQQQMADTQGQFDSSLTRTQFPQRSVQLAQLHTALREDRRLASVSDVQWLWYELLREMQASAQLARFDAEVIAADGKASQASVTRVGLFNVISDGRYLQFDVDSGQLSVLPRQPSESAQASARALQTGQSDSFHLDPTRGQLLSLLLQAPDLRERFEQGGAVGYVIVGLGALALMVGVLKLAQLYWLGLRVGRQRRDPHKAKPNNPLGRLLALADAHFHLGGEALELKLSEAVMRELAPINRWIPFIKIIAAVAPLLGLLGTVLGMILTFQAITLLGTGDPKLMAGGISTALVTTVLGLLVAIPVLLLHSLAAAKARQLSQVLEQQALGLVAQQSEQVEQPRTELRVA